MQVEVDVAFQKGSRILISGWIAGNVQLDDDSLIFSPLTKGDKPNVILVSRKDVYDVLNVPPQNCTGFIIVADKQQGTSIEVRHHDDVVSIDFDALPFVDELIEEKKLAPNNETELEELLIQNDFITSVSNVKTALEPKKKKAFFDFSIGESRVHFDQCVKLDANTIFLFGWVLQRESGLSALHCVVNGQQSDDLLVSAVRFPRSDVLLEIDGHNENADDVGILATIITEEPIEGDIMLLWLDSDNITHSFELSLQSFSQNELSFTEMILSNIRVQRKQEHDGLIRNVLPALTAAWHARLGIEHPAEQRAFGKQVVEPELSLVIPIYGRYDFVQHQIAQFSLDPEFQNYEVIYVLDDPRITHEFLVTCHGVHETFKYPFKAVLSSVNLGFAGANNLGFKFVSSDMILLMNSDVMPKKTGWAGELLHQYRNTTNVGVLGATLLYEDETVQHRGMEFCKDPSHDGLWMNYHPQKGFPLSLCDQFQIQKVNCVTGACMLMTKQLYADIGGFDIAYVLGDFEDSDLCLRVKQLGYEIYVSGSVALYHLERLSQNMGSPKVWKQNLSLLNGLRHTAKWNDFITQITGPQND